MDFLVGAISAGIFPGVPQALTAVASVGDVKQVHTSSRTGQDSIHVNLAPCYGSLNSDALRRMDENTKVMIGTTLSILKSMRNEDRTWERIVGTLKGNSLLEVVDGKEIHNSDSFRKAGSHDFKFDGSPDQGTINEIKSWFTKLIGDSDIVNTVNFDINDLARIVAQTGVTVNGVDSFFGGSADQYMTVVDVGALRYPDLSNPYFKVYRIKVDAWSHSSRVLFHQEDQNGLNGDFYCARFRPRADTIAALREDVKHMAIAEAEKLFN